MSILTWIEDKKRLKLLNAPKNFAQFSDSNKGLWTRCDKCGVILYIKHLKENQRVCFGCSYHLQMMSGERIENLLDKVPLKRNLENDGFSSDSQRESQASIAFNDGSAKKISRVSEASKVSKSTGERSHRLLIESARSAKSYDKKRNFGFSERSSRVSEVRSEPSGTRIDFRENMISTWRPLDETVSPCDPLKFADQKNYKDRLQDAQERTGLQDAVQTGTGMIDGIPVALAVMDFSFMGGSMGSVVGEKITRLIEYATQEGLTLIIVSASGGARMQEGVFSLMQMAKISSALQIYQSCAKLLYISILTSPTTGGVTASFAMLGDIIFAEPKALIAFAGRRVIEQTLCEDLPDDFQTSEYMLHHGLVDLIVPRRFLRQALSETIRLYQKAPFKKRGRIEFGVQNPITFLTEEKIRRQWVRVMGSINADNALGDDSSPSHHLATRDSSTKRTFEISEVKSKPGQSYALHSFGVQRSCLADASRSVPRVREGLRSKLSRSEVRGKQMRSGLYPLRESIAYNKPKMKAEGLQSGDLYAPTKYENEQYREILTSFRTMLDLFFPIADKKNLFLPISRNKTQSTGVYVQRGALYRSAKMYSQQSFKMYFNLRLKNEFYTNKTLIRHLKYSLFSFLVKKTVFLTDASSRVCTKLRFVSEKGSKRKILFADAYKAPLCKQAIDSRKGYKNSSSVMQVQSNNQNGNLPSYLLKKPAFFRKNDRSEITESVGLRSLAVREFAHALRSKASERGSQTKLSRTAFAASEGIQNSRRKSLALIGDRKGKLRQKDQGGSRCYAPIARLPFLKKAVNHKNLRGAIFNISSTTKISSFLSFRALQKNRLYEALFYKGSVFTKAKLLQSKALYKLVQSKSLKSKIDYRLPKIIDQVAQNGLYGESNGSNLFYKASISRDYLTKRSFIGDRLTLNYKIKPLHVFDLYEPDLINEVLQSLATHQKIRKQGFIENGKKVEKWNKPKIEGKELTDKKNLYRSSPDFKNQENDLGFLNQAIEMAATESVEWRAFYVDQQLSEKIGVLNDFSPPILKKMNNSNENILNVANVIFYRLICRSKKGVDKKQ